jgi:hypothetical protein
MKSFIFLAAFVAVAFSNCVNIAWSPTEVIKHIENDPCQVFGPDWFTKLYDCGCVTHVGVWCRPGTEPCGNETPDIEKTVSPLSHATFAWMTLKINATDFIDQVCIEESFDGLVASFERADLTYTALTQQCVLENKHQVVVAGISYKRFNELWLDVYKVARAVCFFTGVHFKEGAQFVINAEKKYTFRCCIDEKDQNCLRKADSI